MNDTHPNVTVNTSSLRPFDLGDALANAFKLLGDKTFLMRLVIMPSVILTVIYFAAIYLMAPHVSEMMSWSWGVNQAAFGAGDISDVSEIGEILKKMILPYTLMMVGWIVLYAMCEAAFHRGKLKTGTYKLRFGRDEINVLICQLLIFLVWMAVYIGGAILIGIIVSLLGMISGILSGITAFIIIIALICALVYFPVKFCPAAALSVKNSRLSFLSSWRVSKGRFWPYFGALLIMCMVGYIGLYIIYMITLFIATGDPGMILAMSGLSTDDPAAVIDTLSDRFKNPIYLLIAFVCLYLYCAVCIVAMLMIASVSTYTVKITQTDDVDLFR